MDIIVFPDCINSQAIMSKGNCTPLGWVIIPMMLQEWHCELMIKFLKENDQEGAIAFSEAFPTEMLWSGKENEPYRTIIRKDLIVEFWQELLLRLGK